MEKLLIIGIDSILGSNLALSLSERFDVSGLYLQQPVSVDECHIDELNWDSPEDVVDMLHDYQPDWVIHCGPQSRTSWDDVLPNPDETYAENFDFICALTDATDEVGCHLTVMTSDAVFVGPRLFHDEFDNVEGECILASAVSMIEKRLAKRQALLVRTHAYGWSPTDSSTGYAEDIWKALADGNVCRVDADRHSTPILASDLADLLYRAYELKLRGTFHITGAERTSPFRFAAELARAFGLGGRHVQLEAAQDYSSNRRLNIQESSLNTRRARRVLKLPMPMLREGLQRFAEQAASGFRSRLNTVQVEYRTRSKAA